MTTGLAAAGPNRMVVDAAAAMARSGGTAVDAAVSATLVSMVTEPGVTSPAGGAFVVHAAPGEEPVAVDGNVEMPGRSVPRDLFGQGVRAVRTAYGGGVTMGVGHGSVATPGALAALADAHAERGRLPWADVVQPAVDAAHGGFPLGTAAASYLELVGEDVFGWHDEGWAALRRPDGTALRAGDVVVAPDLARTLEMVAVEGARTLYDGELGRAVAADMAEHGGLVGADDLAAYRVHRVPALTVDVDDWVYATVPPPGIGGPVLAAMLLLMGDRPRGDWTPDDRAHLARVQGAVLRHRATHLDVAGDRVSAGQRLLDDVRRQGSAWLRTSPSTVHVSCVDGEGMACAVTASSGYGSGVVTPGTGLMLNNCLGEPELNRPGLHAWRPGDRLPSNMAPTVGRRADGAVLAIGSPGADRITTALVQVLAALGGGVGLQEAVDAPRLHVRPVRGGGLEVDHEADAELPPPTSGGEPLVAREMPPRSMYFGGVAAAMRHPDGTLEAAADPRRAGAVVLVD